MCWWLRVAAARSCVSAARQAILLHRTYSAAPTISQAHSSAAAACSRQLGTACVSTWRTRPRPRQINPIGSDDMRGDEDRTTSGTRNKHTGPRVHTAHRTQLIRLRTSPSLSLLVCEWPLLVFSSRWRGGRLASPRDGTDGTRRRSQRRKPEDGEDSSWTGHTRTTELTTDEDG